MGKCCTSESWGWVLLFSCYKSSIVLTPVWLIQISTCEAGSRVLFHISSFRFSWLGKIVPNSGCWSIAFTSMGSMGLAQIRQQARFGTSRILLLCFCKQSVSRVDFSDHYTCLMLWEQNKTTFMENTDDVIAATVTITVFQKNLLCFFYWKNVVKREHPSMYWFCTSSVAFVQGQFKEWLRTSPVRASLQVGAGLCECQDVHL